jgi:hypothetical protein
LELPKLKVLLLNIHKLLKLQSLDTLMISKVTVYTVMLL